MTTVTVRTHHATGPNTSHKAVYRVNVWCEHCQAVREFVYDTGHWVCQTCLYVETTGGELAPSPWVKV